MVDSTFLLFKGKTCVKATRRLESKKKSLEKNPTKFVHLEKIFLQFLSVRLSRDDASVNLEI